MAALSSSLRLKEVHPETFYILWKTLLEGCLQLWKLPVRICIFLSKRIKLNTIIKGTNIPLARYQVLDLAQEEREP